MDKLLQQISGRAAARRATR